MNKGIGFDHTQTAISELTQDLKELLYLNECLRNSLTRFEVDITKTSKFIPPATLNSIKLVVSAIKKDLDITFHDLRVEIDKARNSSPTLNLYFLLLKEKGEQFDKIRTNTQIIPSLITATDWQSPSYAYSLVSQAGRQTGKISGTINDYKRDVHLDEKYFQEIFLKEYIDAKNKFFLKAYLTNSGQAAFQTILTYLISESKIGGKVLVGQSSYFQYKQILSGVFKKRIISVNELNTEEILKHVQNDILSAGRRNQNDKISAIFLDSQCNSPNIAMPNLAKIMQFIYKNAKSQVYLIIDNSCLAVSCQPFLLRGNNKNVHLIVFESLNKYYQFGLDRVTAGIIVCENSDAGGIFDYRKHSGTNITDSSVYSLPFPNRKLLTMRLKRHQRNAFSLADYLVSLPSPKIDKIVYPGLKLHPAYRRAINYPFMGSFLNIQFKDKFDTPKMMKKFIELTLKTAGKNQVNIVAGTSFGLNTTRIYLTSLWAKFDRPFLRISAGTEDMIELEKIKAVFAQTIKKF